MVNLRLPIVNQLLEHAYSIIDRLKGCVVIIQSAGEVYTGIDAVLSCLIQVIVDENCRTMQGYCNLIEKEWVSIAYILLYFLP